MTGGFGFIGKHVIRNIRDISESYDVVVFSDLRAAETNANFAKEYDLKVITGDVRDTAGVMEACASEKPNVAVHLAALTGVEKCNLNPSLAFSVNVYGSYNVIMGSANAGAKLMFISSREVYGEGIHHEHERTHHLLRIISRADVSSASLGFGYQNQSLNSSAAPRATYSPLNRSMP